MTTEYPDESIVPVPGQYSETHPSPPPWVLKIHERPPPPRTTERPTRMEDSYFIEAECVPIQNWGGGTEIPPESPLHEDWRNTNWMSWPGSMWLSPTFISRSYIGICAREGLNIRGQIIPICYAFTECIESLMIFTTTGGAGRYLLVANRDTYYDLGTFEILSDIWMARDLLRNRVKVTLNDDIGRIWTPWMRATGGRWWEYCEGYEDLREIVELHTDLKEEEIEISKEIKLRWPRVDGS
ncbi:hypothetical protein C8R46DRAFT_1362514 [Mycena filopes]|nr:hypothetical protein C8R46DRAFT_1362514 [Mycena filopes]